MPISFVNPSVDAAFGGAGGAPYNLAAPNPAAALVGLRLWSGAVVDAVAPIFANLMPDGTLGPHFFGERRGGPGGAPTDLRLPGQVVVGLWVNWGAVVDKVRVGFRSWTAGGVSGPETWSAIVGGQGGDQGPREYLYNLGRCAIAVHGRAGPADNQFARLDTIGLASAEPQIV